MWRKLKHKFGAKRTQVKDRSYGSKLEASYAKRLDSAKEAGHLLFYLEQIGFRLPGGITYKLDFLEFWTNGDVILTEVKGFETETWKIKHKLFLETYPFLELNIVKKV